MATLSVPPVDLTMPTLGPQLCAFYQDRLIFGPGSLHDQPARLDDEKTGLVFRAYEVWPERDRDGAPMAMAGMRRFERVAWELRKGLAKTELAAWVSAGELHPEAPVRFDHWAVEGEESEWELQRAEPREYNRYVYREGEPVGKPVETPFIPMLATTEEQVQELAYGVLKYILENCADAELFDIGLDRIVRLGPTGKYDGEAKAVSNAPGARDGARTTFQHFDEPHRIYLPRQRESVETMLANMGKRILEDPWTLATSTAGKPGQGSVQEDFRKEAEKIAAGDLPLSGLMFFSRWAGQEHDDLSTVEKREAAVADATGPVGEWGRGQFNRIARDYDREGVDKAYWEQVWLNRWRKAGSQTFDMTKVGTVRQHVIPDGAFIAVGFDGARRRDSTALVITEIDTGMQQLVGLWERPPGLADDADWEVPEEEVTQAVAELRQRYEMWELWGDPPYWTETLASWGTKWPDQITEYWTNQYRRMAYGIRAYNEAFDTGACQICGLDWQVDAMLRHMGSAGKKDLNIVDDQGRPLSIMTKMEGRLSEKFDAAMAGNISWIATLDARRKGVRPQPKIGMPTRIR